MKDYKSLCILGRQPALGLAELESLYGAEHVEPVEGGALLDIATEEINFKRLGGTIKTARVLNILASSDWSSAVSYLRKTIPEHLQYVEGGKLTLGISVYGLEVSVTKLNQDLLSLKRAIRKTGKPVRIVPNKNLELNSAQVLHNKLTHRGGWELVLLRSAERTIIAQTLFVQDIEAYGARDQARPKRDARVGMLPPKLAQIIINLNNSPAGSRILDPFCGTGVILQEAMLMGYSVLGTDIEPRLADYTKANIQWLVLKYPQIEAQTSVEVADATNYTWPRFTAVASEVFLGRPLNLLPASDRLREIIQDANTVTKKFLRNLAPQLQKGQKVTLAVPAWQTPGREFISLPLIDQLTDMGYNYLDLKHVPRDELLYYRKDQIVARQLLRLEKS